MSNRKTLSEKIEAAKMEAAQKDARVKELLQQQKAQERKSRNHRLCLRGGKLEKLLPQLVKLTEEQFENFVQKTLLTGFAEKVLRGLVESEAASSTAVETIETTQNTSANSNSKTETTTRVTG